MFYFFSPLPMEHTFILLKPDAYERRLVGKIISRLEEKGFRLTAMNLMKPDDTLIDKHYEEHVNRPWYNDFKKYFKSSKIVAMIWSGKNVINQARKIIGATNPMEAEMGTIRGDYGMDTGRNLVHGSDSLSAAEREIELWFGDNYRYENGIDHAWIYEK